MTTTTAMPPFASDSGPRTGHAPRRRRGRRAWWSTLGAEAVERAPPDTNIAADDRDEDDVSKRPLLERASHLHPDDVWLRGPRGGFLVRVVDDGWVVTSVPDRGANAPLCAVDDHNRDDHDDDHDDGHAERDGRFVPASQPAHAQLAASLVDAYVALPPGVTQARRATTTATMRQLLERLLRERARRAGAPVDDIVAALATTTGNPLVWTQKRSSRTACSPPTCSRTSPAHSSSPTKRTSSATRRRCCATTSSRATTTTTALVTRAGLRDGRVRRSSAGCSRAPGPRGRR